MDHIFISPVSLTFLSHFLATALIGL